MIGITADIIEYTEEGVEYTLKEYTITSSYPNSIVKIIMDKFKNQISTNDDGVAVISTSILQEHTLKVTIDGETITETL